MYGCPVKLWRHLEYDQDRVHSATICMCCCIYICDPDQAWILSLMLLSPQRCHLSAVLPAHSSVFQTADDEWWKVGHSQPCHSRSQSACTGTAKRECIIPTLSLEVLAMDPLLAPSINYLELECVDRMNLKCAQRWHICSPIDSILC